MGVTSIEWTDRSVNPIRARDLLNPGSVGHFCEKISPGCANCYSSRMQRRFHMPGFPGHGKQAENIGVFFDAERLREVLRRKTPTKWFWCDMTDMFGEWVPDEWIDQCFAVMALTPHHVHQVLTKRPERMAAYLARTGRSIEFLETQARILGYTLRFEMPMTGERVGLVPWPLPGVWLGTSVENQKAADARIPHLLKCPAAIRFLSCEPLLDDINLMPAFVNMGEQRNERTGERRACCIHCKAPAGPPRDGGDYFTPAPCGHRGIHWVIVGGESGPGARPMALEWARSIVEQCRDAGVSCFMKQLGSKPVTWDVGAGDDFTPDAPGYVPVGYRGKPLTDSKGGDINEWPDDLQVRQFPASPALAAARGVPAGRSGV